MEYTKKYYELKGRLNSSENRIALDNQIEVIFLPFNSENHWQRILDESDWNFNNSLGLEVPDSQFFENNHFNYPIFVPRKQVKFSKAILLLHGLNERSWDKYLPWAYFLAQQTGNPVVLFPIAFHINRSPVSWINPKAMASLVNLRKQKFGAETLTYANAALSIRLTEDPLRFLKSGHQTAEDLAALIKQIHRGLIPLFAQGTTVNVFAYSIGAFIAQIMLLAFPKNLFTESKFFLFCGGAYFDDMDGVSRLIMDKVAFDSIKTYYSTGLKKDIECKKLLGSLLTEFPLGKSFFAMLHENNDPILRTTTCKNITNKIAAVSLEKDTVIPSWGIEKTLREFKSHEFEILDFPYDYSHEVPFPVSGKTSPLMVDQCFNKVFSKAVEFLS